jgi:hypothetical protein
MVSFRSLVAGWPRTGMQRNIGPMKFIHGIFMSRSNLHFTKLNPSDVKIQDIFVVRTVPLAFSFRYLKYSYLSQNKTAISLTF